MKPRRQRMLAVGLAATGTVIASVFTLKAFEENMMFYIEISDSLAKHAASKAAAAEQQAVTEN